MDPIRALVEISPDLMVRFDSRLRYTYVNPAAELAFGLQAQAFIGKHLDELTLPAPFVATWQTMLRRVCDSRRDATFEFSYPTEDGSPVRYETRMVPDLDPDGRVSSIVAYSRALTERNGIAKPTVRQPPAAEIRGQAPRMEAVSRLAGKLAHDFNNLLTVIRGNLQLALMELPVNHGVRLELEEISQAVDRAVTITRQLLAFSGRQVRRARIIELNSLVTRLEPSLRRFLGDEIRLTLSLADGPTPIEADPVQIEQVILNLVSNAADVLDGAGEVTIETHEIAIDSQDSGSDDGGLLPGHYVMLRVHDSGPGMSDEVRPHVFEPFFTTKPSSKGNGLGLSTVYGIVHQSGGTIELDSSASSGTTVRIYFPAARPVALTTPTEATGQERETSIAADLHARTVLLVEDETEVRRLLRKLLVRWGYHVIESTDGADAVAVVQSHRGPIDLILTDVVMPRMSGPEAIRQIAALRPEIPVLFMSGYPIEVLLRQGLLESEATLLEKPISPQTLAERIEGFWKPPAEAAGHGPAASTPRRAQ